MSTWEDKWQDFLSLMCCLLEICLHNCSGPLVGSLEKKNTVFYFSSPYELRLADICPEPDFPQHANSISGLELRLPFVMEAN